MQSRIRNVAIAAAAAVFVAWFFVCFADRDARTPGGGAGAETQQSKRGAPESKAVAALDAKQKQQFEKPKTESEAARSEARAAESKPASAPSGPVLVIRGAVANATEGVVDPLAVAVTAVDAEGRQLGFARGAVSKVDNRFEISDSGKLRDAVANGSMVWVVLVEGKRSVTSVKNAERDAVRSTAPDGREQIVIEKDLAFKAASRVKGRVVDPAGAPVDKATIILLVEDPRESMRAIANETTAADGAFTLISTVSGTATLAAVKDDFSITTQSIAIADAATVDVGDVTIQPGVSISGRVRNAIPAYDLAGGKVTAILNSNVASRVFVVERIVLSRSATGIRRPQPSAEIDKSGNFAIKGLEPGSYTLSILGPRWGSFGGDPRDVFKVTAPASGVELFWEPAILGVRVTSEGKPLSNATATFRPSDVGGLVGAGTGQDGMAFVTLPESDKVTISVSRQGFVAMTKTADGPRRGSDRIVDFDLRASANPATVTVRVLDERGRRIPRATVRIVSKTAEAFEASTSQREGEEDLYMLGDVPPGEYNIEVRAGEWLDNRNDYCAESFDVVLSPNEELARDVTLRPGGVVQVRVMDVSGKNVPANCVIRDEGGRVVHRLFCSEHAKSHRLVGNATQPHPPDTSDRNAAYIVPPLPPGKYELSAELDGYEPEQSKFEVKAGGRASAFITLKKR